MPGAPEVRSPLQVIGELVAIGESRVYACAIVGVDLFAHAKIRGLSWTQPVSV